MVLHIITGLSNGGAEGVLFRLCKQSPSDNIVFSLKDEGKYGPLLEKLGVKVYYFNLCFNLSSLISMWKMFKLIRLHQPKVIQTWMYHADLIGGLVSRIAGNSNIFWNVRQSFFDAKKVKKSTLVTAKVCAYLSYFIPKSIICCAYNAIPYHVNLGYQKSKFHVISNGFDLSSYIPSMNSRIGFRQSLNLDDNTFLIGMVGRYDPQKDHSNLLCALSFIKNYISSSLLVLIGNGLTLSNKLINDEIAKFDLTNKVLLLGVRNDVPFVMNGLDLLVLSSSYGEAFPNVIAEAMGCGVPCITTDVGDAAYIVGDTGWVVPPNDPSALSTSILDSFNERNLNNKAWLNRKVACRNRIADKFSLDMMVTNYHSKWGI